MNSDLLMALSSKLERLYNRMIAQEANYKKENNSLKNEISSLQSEIEKTNAILEKIYCQIKNK